MFSVNSSSNKTILVNGTVECIETLTCTVRPSEGWIILALFMAFGVFLFLSALCCGVWVDEDEANSKDDLVLITGLGKDLLHKVPLHAIRLEDFVYLLPPFKESSSSVGSTRHRGTSKSKSAQPTLFGKVDFSLGKGTLEKRSKENIVKENGLSPLHFQPKSHKSTKSEVSFSTSVNHTDSMRNVNKSKTKTYLKQQVASTKSKISGKSMSKIKQKKTQKTHTFKSFYKNVSK